METLYKRKECATLKNVIIDHENNIVKGINDIGSTVVMTITQFEELYEEVSL